MMISQGVLKPEGFGAYLLPAGLSFPRFQLNQKIQRVARMVFQAFILGASIAWIPASVPIKAALVFYFSYQLAQSIFKLIAIFYRSAPTQGVIGLDHETSLPPLSHGFEDCFHPQIISDGIKGYQKKLELIEKAEKNVFMSGCYCGGKAFGQLLTHIEKNIEKKPNLSVSLLASEIPLTQENKKQIDSIKARFKERFICLITPEIFPALTDAPNEYVLATNHTKLLVIDEGKEFLIGGSGVLSTWSDHTGLKAPISKESFNPLYDFMLETKAFRDMDFAFESPHPSLLGKKVYVEMVKLFRRFGFDQQVSLPAPPPSIPSSKKRHQAACFAEGPEKVQTAFLDEIVSQIDQAKKTITIAHMYFHPPKKMQKALLGALNRGVSIQIITNRSDKNSPKTHKTFAELSLYHAQSLFEGRKKPNLKLYEYAVPNVTYHKKVILFDEETALIGSSNIGTKSLLGIDYEINLKIKSLDFVKAISEVIQEDLRFCEENQSHQIGLRRKATSFFQSLFAAWL